MVRLVRHSVDMTATCAIPPGIPTYQIKQMFLNVGNCGLIQCVSLAAEAKNNECIAIEKALLKE